MICYTCTLYIGSTLKIVEHFGDPSRAFRDEAFLRSLRAAAYSFKFTNMHMERALAAAGRSDDQTKSPYAERICSNTVLSEVLHEHMAQPGRINPCFTTRKELVEGNVQVHARREETTWKWGAAKGGEGVPGFTMFKREKEHGRDTMKKAAYHKWLVEVGKE